MPIELVVTIPFGDYKVGERITDKAEIDKALETNAAHVVKVAPEKPGGSKQPHPKEP